MSSVKHPGARPLGAGLGSAGLAWVSDGAVNSGVIAAGQIVYMVAATGKLATAAASGTWDTSTIGRGLVGIAKNATTAGDQPVEFEPIVGGQAYAFQSYGTAPTLALMAAAAPYGMINDAGVDKVNLSNTTNGIAYKPLPTMEDSQPLIVATNGAKAPKISGWAVGDQVLVTFGEAMRFFK